MQIAEFIKRMEALVKFARKLDMDVIVQEPLRLMPRATANQPVARYTQIKTTAEIIAPINLEVSTT